MNTLERTQWWLTAILLAVAILLPATALRADDDDSDSHHRRKVDMTEVPADPKDEHVNLRNVKDKIEEGFKIRRSLHYSIIYNTSEEDVAAFEYAIEKTYRACAKWCLSMGIDIQPPKQKMLTHFFNDFDQYNKYGVIVGRGPTTPDNPGVFLFATNYTYFFNFRNTPSFKNAKLNIEKQISELGALLKRGDVPSEQKAGIRKAILALRAQQNLMNTFGGDLTEEILQHEVSHQVLFNIGFHNKGAILQGANPRWFAEGIAQLFEPIDKGEGSGFGRVNHSKAAQFRDVVKAKAMYPIDGFVSDIRFFFVGNVGGIAYPQAWALAHYLTRTKRAELKAFVDDINKRDGDFVGTPEKELELFEKHFGKVDKKWTKRFLAYMDKVN